MSPSDSATSASQWSWKWANWAGGKGRASSSSAAGNSDAAPVTEFATSSDSRLEWLLRRRLQYVSAITRPSRSMTRASL